jgi:hypothetical protein
MTFSEDDHIKGLSRLVAESQARRITTLLASKHGPTKLQAMMSHNVAMHGTFSRLVPSLSSEHQTAYILTEMKSSAQATRASVLLLRVI